MSTCGVIGDHSNVRAPASVMPWIARMMRKGLGPPRCAAISWRTDATSSATSSALGSVVVEGLRRCSETTLPA